MRVFNSSSAQTGSKLVSKLGRFLCGIGLACAFGSPAWSFDDGPALDSEAAGGVGLQGILPDRTPDGLTLDDFALLDEAWLDWAEGAAEAVDALYTGELGDVESQRQTIAAARIKLDTMRKSLGSSDYRAIHSTLSDLHSNLVRRLDIAEAVLDTVEADVDAARAARIQREYNRLGNAVSDLRNDMYSVPNGSAWLPYVSADELARIAREDDISADALNTVAGAYGKIAGRGALADEGQREFLSRDSFVRLESALDGVLAASQVVDSDEYRAALRDAAQRFVAGLEQYEATGSRQGAAQARLAYTELKSMAADGGLALSGVMREHYFNYNMRVIITEGMLNRIIGENRVESGWINEYNDGAQVMGVQCTNATVSVDLKESYDNIHFNILLNATITSNAQASTNQADVFLAGTHYLYATKPVWFDGHQFTTGRAQAWASANNQAVAAETPVSGIPLLGGIADSIALKEARKRVAETNGELSGRIAGEGASKLDQESDSSFASAGTEIEASMYGPLRENGLYPDAMSVSSSESQALVRTRLMDVGELGGSKPSELPGVPTNGMVLRIHESLLNNGASRLDLNGKVLTEDEVGDLLRERLSTVTGRDIAIEDQPEAEGEDAGADEGDSGALLVFDENDPIRFQIREDQVQLVIRAGLRREGEDDIPTQIITVPLQFELADGQVTVSRGSVGVAPVEPPENAAEQIARAGVVRQNIESAMPPRTVDANVEFDVEGKVIRMQIVEIRARGDWLTIATE